MTPYEAETTKEYLVRIPGFSGTVLGSLKQYAAQVIDTSWKYSWHWNGGDEPWWKKAKMDCASRIELCERELAKLRAVMEQLDNIRWEDE